MTTTETTLHTFDFAGLELRVLMKNGDLRFVLGDVNRLVYGRTDGLQFVTDRLLPDEVSLCARTTLGMKPGRKVRLITEAGLYRLIMRSDKPEARKFQDWVTREVLPAIRKTGGYLLNEEARETAKADDWQGMPLPEVFAQMVARVAA